MPWPKNEIENSGRWKHLVLRTKVKIRYILLEMLTNAFRKVKGISIFFIWMLLILMRLANCWISVYGFFLWCHVSFAFELDHDEQIEVFFFYVYSSNFISEIPERLEICHKMV